MMTPYEDPDDYVCGFEHKPCPFHEIAPGASYPGCTCAGNYYRRKATPQEREENIKRRQEQQERIARAWAVVSPFGKVTVESLKEITSISAH